jgi:hypothetical protein
MALSTAMLEARLSEGLFDVQRQSCGGVLSIIIIGIHREGVFLILFFFMEDGFLFTLLRYTAC